MKRTGVSRCPRVRNDRGYAAHAHKEPNPMQSIYEPQFIAYQIGLASSQETKLILVFCGLAWDKRRRPSSLPQIGEPAI